MPRKRILTHKPREVSADISPAVTNLRFLTFKTRRKKIISKPLGLLKIKRQRNETLLSYKSVKLGHSEANRSHIPKATHMKCLEQGHL